MHGDPSVRCTTYFPNIYTQGPPCLLALAPSFLPPMNLAFQVGANHQEFSINPSLMMNDLYFQNVPGAVHGSGFDVIGYSSNPEFPARAPFVHSPFVHGIYLRAPSPPGSYNHDHEPNHG